MMLTASRFSILWIMASTLMLVLAGWLDLNGFVSDSTMRLWAKAILQMDGPIGFRSSEALYPPLPFLSIMILHTFVGVNSIPIPTLFSALVMGLVAALSYSYLRSNGPFRRVWAGLIVTLIFANPLVLFAVSDTPELASLSLGIWILATGLITLRSRGNAPDMMKVGLGLMIIGLSSSYGLLICLAALPFMALVVPPQMLMASPVGTILAIAFPVLCAIGSLLLLSSIFDTPLVATRVITDEVRDVDTLLLAAILCASPAVLSLIGARLAHFDMIPIAAAIGAIGGAVILDHHISFVNDPLKSPIPLLIIAPLAASYWPRRWIFSPLIVIGLAVVWIGGLGMVVKSSDATVVEWSGSMRGQIVEGTEVTEVAAFLKNKSGVMLDAEQHPDLIVALKGIEQLVVAGSPAFELVVYGGKPSLPYIVMKNTPDAPIIKDRLRRRFPEEDSLVPFGYHLAFTRGSWEIFERNATR